MLAVNYVFIYSILSKVKWHKMSSRRTAKLSKIYNDKKTHFVNQFSLLHNFRHNPMNCQYFVCSISFLKIQGIVHYIFTSDTNEFAH